jgi:glycosyltransferase involved in cell wall biosynthesis
MKLALVVQRYGLDINGGAELHCRWIAERLKKYAETEVLTTKAVDYITWKNHFPEDEDVVNGVRVRRFPVARARRPSTFGRLQNQLLDSEHTDADELRWLDEEGPLAPSLIDYVRERQADYDYFIFFSYRYYHSYHGIRAVPGKSLLVPTAEHDPVINLRIFRELFHLPRAFIYNSVEERSMINAVSHNEGVFGDVVGVGSEVPAAPSADAFRSKHGLAGPYLMYIGRIDENKGCHKLFEYFARFKREAPSDLKLVLAGSTVMRIPARPDILYLGFMPEEDKFNALAGAELLAMPSYFESLSMVTLEAWALGKPVLANALCDVLKGQCRRSNGGLYYENYPEFAESLSLLLSSSGLRRTLGENGRRYVDANYRWEVIENKYLAVLDHLEKEKAV